MRKKEFTDIKAMDVKGLKTKVQNLRQEIADLVIDKNMNKLQDVKAIAKRRRDLAQVLTVLRQKQLLSELESQTGEVK